MGAVSRERFSPLPIAQSTEGLNTQPSNRKHLGDGISGLVILLRLWDLGFPKPQTPKLEAQLRALRARARKLLHVLHRICLFLSGNSTGKSKNVGTWLRSLGPLLGFLV